MKKCPICGTKLRQYKCDDCGYKYYNKSTTDKSQPEITSYSSENESKNTIEIKSKAVGIIILLIFILPFILPIIGMIIAFVIFLVVALSGGFTEEDIQRKEITKTEYNITIDNTFCELDKIIKF